MPGDAVKPAAAAGPAAAWLLKLPSRGDFVAGGPPTAFVEGWRDWALAGVAALRAGGADAVAAFSAAPFWRFAAGPGVFAPQGAVGVAAPGADSVGRAFPALAAAVGAGAADPSGPWFDAAEAALRQALSAKGEPNALAAALRAAPAAEAVAGGAALFVAVAADGRRVRREGPADPGLFRTLFSAAVGGAREPGP
jgi:type VI secretion system ImpM family protein